MTTTSPIGRFTLCGGTYFKHVCSKFSHIGDDDTIVFKDCDGNYAELYCDEDGDEIATLTDFTKDDMDVLDVLRDLEFCSLTNAAIDHLAELGFNADNLPAKK